ncbi:MAG: tRNA (adenosine(37)-N6)-threonylcarbamoyltransferase complex dimerization subunit type 1 TsaB [Planctomycetota bacterium]
MDSYTLAFEVVSQAGSIACMDATGTIVDQRRIGHRRFAQDLVPLLDACIREHGRPGALAVAAGPGSFTGLRVSVIAARSIAWIDDLPVHAVDSLTARAVQAGPGCWWVLMGLKRDTTFHACIRVDMQLRSEVLMPVQAQGDAAAPDLRSLPPEAVAIGPALDQKPDLLTTWAPDRSSGSTAGLDASGVALAARHSAARHWSTVLPAYHQVSAPELQRKGA